jgi:hypothetical protein
MPFAAGKINLILRLKTQWTFAGDSLKSPCAMKCETINTILTFVLGALVVLGAIFAMQTVNHTREFRALQKQMIAYQSNLNRVNLLLNDAAQYGRTHPDINHVIEPFEAKPAEH